MPLEAGQPDPYDLLGVGRDATAGDVRQAYRRAAQASHPDRLPADPGAAGRFAALATAYETLRDPLRRAAYDRAHPPPAPPPPQRPPGEAVHLLWARAAGPARRPALWAGPVHITPPGAR